MLGDALDEARQKLEFAAKESYANGIRDMRSAVLQ